MLDLTLLLLMPDDKTVVMPTKLRKDLSKGWRSFYDGCAGIKNFYEISNASIRNNLKTQLHFLDWQEWVDFWYDNFPLVEDKLCDCGYTSQAACAEPFHVVEERLLSYINKKLITCLR